MSQNNYNNNARSKRQLMLAENIRHTLSVILQKNPIFEPETGREIGLVISEVRVSPDAKNAKIFFQGQKQDEKILNKERINNYIRRQLAKNIYSKYVPKLFFIYDEVSENAANIEKYFL